jgi:hypothetical protein
MKRALLIMFVFLMFSACGGREYKQSIQDPYAGGTLQDQQLDSNQPDSGDDL